MLRIRRSRCGRKGPCRRCGGRGRQTCLQRRPRVQGPFILSALVWYSESSRRLPFRRSAGTSGCMAPCPCVRRSMPADSHCLVVRQTQRLLPQCRRVGRQTDRSSCAASSVSLRMGLSSAFRVGYSLVTMRATAPPAAAVARGAQDRQARPAGWWGWRETPRVVTERRAEDIRV